jgi:hypothetical protein
MGALLANAGSRTRMPSRPEGLGIDQFDDVVMRRVSVR